MENKKHLSSDQVDQSGITVHISDETLKTIVSSGSDFQALVFQKQKESHFKTIRKLFTKIIKLFSNSDTDV